MSPDTIEVTAAEQPRLFAFLYRLADEARAPRPYRVFFSHTVNAGVFYDLSLLNLIIPSRKNLEIGLGLINVLSLGEVKAVLAHELGHFAQRTMAIGRWVYIGQQIAGHLVARRDAFDRLLAEIGAATWGASSRCSKACGSASSSHRVVSCGIAVASTVAASCPS